MNILIIEPGVKAKILDMRHADVIIAKTGRWHHGERNQLVEEGVVVKHRWDEAGELCEITTVLA